ncbi:MAG: Rrf2 family transcriptional regulator, partial [Thermodesulfobacteriota bacterium]
MLITQKNQYALRAVFELAKRHGEGPVKSSAIAEAQAVPLRFLEVILHQLKRSGFLASKRGYQGGYYLMRRPREITVGDVIRCMDRIEGSPAECAACVSCDNCPFERSCAL